MGFLLNLPNNRKEYIKDINDFCFRDKKVIIRVDFNIPIDDKKTILDDTRIQYSIPTILRVLSDKCKIILLSHLGNPKGVFSEKYSIKFLIDFLYKQLKVPIFFGKDCIGKNIKQIINNLKNGQILLLENLRFHKEEENLDECFSKKISKYGNIYINEAFGVSHRKHSSIAILPKMFQENKCVGFLMKKEITNLYSFINGKVEKPITILLGGAKILSKIKVIENIMKFADYIIIGGGMAYTFIYNMGGNIGKSIIEKNTKIKKIVKKIIEKNKINKNIYFPLDVVATKEFSNNTNTKIFPIYSIPEKWMGLDIGPKSITKFCEIINISKTILWNGPFGVFEFPNFFIGTKNIIKSIVNVTKNNKSFSIIGGGDTIAAMKFIKCHNKVSYLSTGGGAMLEILKNNLLPGIESMII